MEDRRATVTDALQSTTFRLYSSAAAPVTGAGVSVPRHNLKYTPGILKYVIRSRSFLRKRIELSNTVSRNGWAEGWADGWAEGEGKDGFSSLVKQNKKAKICFVIYIAGFFFLNFFCYEVIVKQKIYKRSTNHYWRGFSAEQERSCLL